MYTLDCDQGCKIVLPRARDGRNTDRRSDRGFSLSWGRETKVIEI